MNRLLVVLLAIGAFGVLLVVGRYWNLRPDTAERHIVHRGEVAVLTAQGSTEVWLASDKRHCYSLQVAMTNKDAAALRNAETRGEAFAVRAGTQVRIVGESVSARQVEIADGALKGKIGWVEFEYLRPRKAGEFE
jgi:hypothetical protein